MFYFYVCTALTQQQSNETCAALDTLIANRNVNETGNCTRNNICTAVNCIYNQDPSYSIALDVTFLPCNDPISVHTQIASIINEIDIILLDEISMGNKDIPFPAQINFIFIINVTFIMTITGVNFGVS